MPLNVIQRQLEHANLGITSVYLQGIDNAEIIDTVHARRAPMIPASAGLRQPGRYGAGYPRVTSWVCPLARGEADVPVWRLGQACR